MNTKSEEKGFCQKSIKPWLLVLAALICLTVVWAVLDGKQHFSWRGGWDDSAKEEPWGTTTTDRGAQLALLPLPLDAARTVTPTHGDRGRCHNCHPVAGTGASLPSAKLALLPLPLGAARTVTPTHGDRGRCHNCHPVAGTGASLPRGGVWRQAKTVQPSGSVFDIQEAFAQAAASVRPAVVNLSVTRSLAKRNASDRRFADPFGELVGGPTPWCPIPRPTAAQAPQSAPQGGGLANGVSPWCPMYGQGHRPMYGQGYGPMYGQVCPVHGQMCPALRQNVPQAAQGGLPQPWCPIHGQMCPRQWPTVPPTPQMPLAEQQLQQRMAGSGIGSGIIVDDRGYILTNYHVIAGATSIAVSVSGVRGVQYTGQVVRTDVETDLALVKLHADVEFPTAMVGNSNTIQVGDFVLAIGSPFGLEHTVTSGIISDTDRTLEIEGRRYVDLIQTDAFINRGNSGGPLVNMHGEVIGINTAIYSPTEGFSGVGFAIPINHAREILRGVVQDHTVTRARAALAAAQQLMAAGPETSWLGIDARPVDAFLGKQFKVPGKQGVLVNRVLASSPASMSGIQQGDVIIVCDNRRIKDVTGLRDVLLDKKVGDKVSLQLVRNGKRKRVQVVLSARPADLLAAPSPNNAGLEAEWLGMEIVPLTPAVRQELGVPQTVTGAMVVVEVEGAAALAGVQAGDVLKGINRQPIETPSDFLDVIGRIAPSQRVVLDISRNGTPMYIAIH